MNVENVRKNYTDLELALLSYKNNIFENTQHSNKNMIFLFNISLNLDISGEIIKYLVRLWPNVKSIENINFKNLFLKL